MVIGPTAGHAQTSGGPVQATQGQVRGTISHGGIIARGLSKRFGRLQAVAEINLDFEPGAVIGFLGHNGAGKTTTMRMLCGVLPPSSGTISVGGFDLRTHAKAAARVVGYLPEGSPLYPELRVHEYSYYVPGSTGSTSRRRRSTPPSNAADWAMHVIGSSGSCPRDSGSGSDWRRRSCMSPECWCSTSRRLDWIRCR